MELMQAGRPAAKCPRSAQVRLLRSREAQTARGKRRLRFPIRVRRVESHPTQMEGERRVHGLNGCFSYQSLS